MKEYAVNFIQCDSLPEFLKATDEIIRVRKYEGRKGRVHFNMANGSTEGVSALFHDADQVVTCIVSCNYRCIFRDCVLTNNVQLSDFYRRLRNIVSHGKFDVLLRMYFSRSWDSEYAIALAAMNEALNSSVAIGKSLINDILAQETRFLETGQLDVVHTEQLNSISESVRLLAEKAQLGLYCKFMFKMFNEEKKSGGSN